MTLLINVLLYLMVMNCFAQDWTKRGGENKLEKNNDERGSSRKESIYDNNREETNEINDSNLVEISNQEDIRKTYNTESRKEERGSSKTRSQYNKKKEETNEIDESNLVVSNEEDFSRAQQREEQGKVEDSYTKESRNEELGSSKKESKYEKKKKEAYKIDESNLVMVSNEEDVSSNKGYQDSNWGEREGRGESENSYTKESNSQDSSSRKSTSEDSKNTNDITITKEVTKKDSSKNTMDCKEHEECMTDRAYCHPRTKMCLCKNGAATYPTCNKNSKSDKCQPKCPPNQMCTSDGECACELGGFPPECNTKKCEPFESEMNKQCVCMYGSEKNGSCNKCRKECSKYEVCKKQGNKGYKCVCESSSKALCDLKPGSKSDSPPKLKPEWERWSQWTPCSSTCGNGRRTRRRTCESRGECKGKATDRKSCNERPCQTNCEWCEWGQWAPNPENTCSNARTRTPGCPAATGGGSNCEGEDSQQQLIPTNDLGPVMSQDFHRGTDWPRNVFDVECPGGCIEVTKAVFDCDPREANPDELARVKGLCDGKSRCQFVPGPVLFGREVNCPGKFPASWFDWRCNGNKNQMNVNNNFADMPPMMMAGPGAD